MSMLPIPAGSLLTISSGQYSDYGVQGVFRALKDIDAEQLRSQWISDHPDQTNDYRFETEEFLAWVAKLGFLEPVESYEWHLSDYAKVSEMWVQGPS